MKTDMKKKLTLISKISANVFAVLFGIILVGGIIMKENVPQVTGFLGGTLSETIYDPSDAEKLKENPLAFEYYESEYDNVKAVKEYGKRLIEQVVGEGATLLQNDNDALPLNKGDTVNLYSISSVNLVYAGTGSSGTNVSESVTLKQAFEKEDVGLVVNEGLWNWYDARKSTYGRGGAGGSVGTTFAINEAPWNVIDASKNNTADAAIFVLSRAGGEGADLTITGGSGDMTHGNYLELSPNEISVLKEIGNLKRAGTIGKVIILMNTANPVQCDFMNNAEYGVDAMLWCGDLGTTGANAVADILVNNINPSGKLADTFWVKHAYNPVYANWGAYNYNGNIGAPGSRASQSNTYVAYQEGIYNGYRYTETRYADYVEGNGNAGDFDYEKVVAYPFGYGMSYSDFVYSNFSVRDPVIGSDDYTVSVTVINNGDEVGREAVAIYLQKPYTEGGIEKSAIELVGFAKTKPLAYGEKETVTVSVPRRLLTSYDAYDAKTYVLDAGSYYFTTGNGAHEAINNVLAYKNYSPSNGMTASGDKNLVKEIKIAAADKTTYSTTSYAKDRGIKDDVTAITNRFENADLNLYEGKGDNSITYISRSDWTGTVKFGFDENHQKLNNQVSVTVTEQMKKDVQLPSDAAFKENSEYPVYGSTDTAYTLCDLRANIEGEPVAYNDPMWNDILNQLTYEETVALLGTGFRLTAAIGGTINKPLTIDHNGATGPTLKYVDVPGVNTYTDGANKGLAQRLNDPDKSESSPLYPCNGLCASTFDVELMEEYGKAWGENCLWAGYNGLYGPGLNTHRGAYGGRAFEYYSEDGFLTGKIVAPLVKGMASKGAYVYLKHCVLNDQEKNREGICTWANEQTIREIYLKGFEIAIEEGGAQCVMTGFNRLGVVWTGHQGFCNTVLHDEFGMTGFAVSDWWQDYMTLPAAVFYGNDLPDADKTNLNAFDKYAPDASGNGDYAPLAWAMRESAHRILYTVVQSNAMNGMTANTKIIPITPGWIAATTAFQAVSGVLFGLCAVWWVTMICLGKFLFAKKKDAPATETAA